MNHRNKVLKYGWGALIALSLGIVPLATAHATDITYPTWLDSVKWGGDLRLRHDTLFNTNGTSNRDRERFRVRYGFAAQSGDLTAIFRLASGDSLTQLSANQTEGAGFTKKAIWIDLAYLKYKPFDMLSLMGGRMDNPFWNGWSSSLVWDPDVNTEGYAEHVDGPFGLYANLGQFTLNEAAANHDANPWLFGEQVGIKGNLPGDTKGTLSVADYAYTQITKFALGSSANQGNTRSGGVLTSSFNVVNVDGKFEMRAGETPILLESGYVHNAKESRGKGKNGYIFGTVVGKASKAHTWEAAYYFKHLENNAVVADFVDDDFGPGGTNLAGHILWVGYAPRDNVLLKAMYYNAHYLDLTQTASPKYTSHLMLDVVVKI